MSENPSITDAVKLAAGISLTEAVKGVAGRRTWFADEMFDDAAEEPHDGLRQRGVRFLTGCARVLRLAVLTSILLLAMPGGLDADLPHAVAQKRVALVIGNAAYRHTPELTNPKNDAADIGGVLKERGFHVILGLDLDKRAFDAKVREFAQALQGAEVALFFYAGHGMQVSGHNYLVPVDAKLTTMSALDFETVRLDLVHKAMELEAKTSLLFFDACRDNPLSRTLARAMGLRSFEIGRGLAAIESGASTLISFSTQPGNVALDGTGRNSPFSSALVKQLGTSNDDLNAILIAVRNDVIRQTDRKQVPWEHSALTGRFFFNTPARPSVAVSGPQLRSSEVAEAWSATKDTANIALLEAFVARYRNTFFAELAQARIAELRQMAASLP